MPLRLRARARVVRQRLVDERPQPQQDEPDRHRGRRATRASTRTSRRAAARAGRRRTSDASASARRRSPRPRRSRATSARRRRARSPRAPSAGATRSPAATSTANEPPWPGPKQTSASCAASTAAPSRREPKTATPASNTSTHASGASSDGSWRTTCSGIEPRRTTRRARGSRARAGTRSPGCRPAVLELVDGAQMQARQVDELAHARLVEQAVADDRALDVPEKPAEHDAEDPDRCTARPSSRRARGARRSARRP